MTCGRKCSGKRSSGRARGTGADAMARWVDTHGGAAVRGLCLRPECFSDRRGHGPLVTAPAGWSRSAFVFVLTLAVTACGREQEPEQAAAATADTADWTRPLPTAADSAARLRENRPADSVIVMDRIRFARERHLDTLSTGALMAELGRTFVGTPYAPQTLEADGEERVIINLRALDCVTFVENMLALARTIRAGGAFPEFTREIERIRYRTG